MRIGAAGQARRPHAHAREDSLETAREQPRGRSREIVEGTALLARVAQGDEAALRALWDHCGSRTLALAQRLLGSRMEAEDVVQETFLQVWRQAGRYDSARGRVEAWVVTIARSRALDRLRARGASERAAVASAGVPGEAVPSPSDGADSGQRRARVQQALDALPPDQRRAIELAFFEGLTQREIAERLGDPLGTVKTRVRLGMAKLAGALAELAPEGLT